jgi:hypothetical protein
VRRKGFDDGPILMHDGVREVGVVLSRGIAKIFRKSSFCSVGTCVEVAEDADRVQVRSSTEPSVVVSVTRDEWVDFVRGVKAGEFDLSLIYPDPGGGGGGGRS